MIGTLVSQAVTHRRLAADRQGRRLGAAALPALVAADEGHIVNTSSVNGFWASIGVTTAFATHTLVHLGKKLVGTGGDHAPEGPPARTDATDEGGAE